MFVRYYSRLGKWKALKKVWQELYLWVQYEKEESEVKSVPGNLKKT